MEKKRAERETAKEKAVNTPTPGAPGGVDLALRSNGIGGAALDPHNMHKGWTRVPKIEMGSELVPKSKH